jgi:polyphosphate kinase 2
MNTKSQSEESDKKAYSDDLKALQIQLTRLQNHIIRNDLKVLVVLEGRDAAGKDGAIKRITRHLSPRNTRVVALDPPSDRDRRSWYFQRYVTHLPVAGEMTLFNRSWYNRAGVERVMGFCTEEEYEEFLNTAPLFENLLDHCGVRIIKYYLDITKSEQHARLKDRQNDPLRQWKRSKLDGVATKHWEDYTAARDKMLPRTHSLSSPWTIVSADDKRAARIGLIRDLISRFEFDGKESPQVNSSVVFAFLETARLAR